MEKRELTCIGCPLGCAITVTLEGGEVKEVVGFTCKRGKEYACKEVTNPTRIVTSTVRLTGSKTGAAVVSCKTAQDIPKGKIFAVAAALKQVVAKAPVEIGDVPTSPEPAWMLSQPRPHSKRSAIRQLYKNGADENPLRFLSCSEFRPAPFSMAFSKKFKK